MNRFFGFIKEKLIEAKEENQAEIQNIVNAFDSQPYNKQKMLTSLQQIKTNYLEWNIMIANQASTGLYFAQIHNRTCLLKKAKTQKEGEERIAKNEIVLEQMQKTLKELRNIAKLNKDWANSMSSKVQRLGQRVTANKKNRQILEVQREIIENSQTKAEQLARQSSQQKRSSLFQSQKITEVQQQQKENHEQQERQAKQQKQATEVNLGLAQSNQEAIVQQAVVGQSK